MPVGAGTEQSPKTNKLSIAQDDDYCNPLAEVKIYLAEKDKREAGFIPTKPCLSVTNLNDLYSYSFKGTPPIIENFLYPGVQILAGAPKVGKSFLVGQIAYHVSMGIPFWGMDQGGFSVEKRFEAAQRAFDATGVESSDLTEWRELQTRWNQFGCFIPLYRAHGQFPLREVWNIAPEDHPAYKTIVWYDRLRYRLMPYLYSMAGWAHFKDYTLMRGLIMDFNGDKNVENIPDQWMFGPALMACPVGHYKARNRAVYFPKQCGWYDFYTGQHIEGGQTLVVDAPYERIPVFVREGAIIPFGPEMEWCDEKPAELINLYVYEGADGQFQLYEDEGTNYNYEKGKYATIDISYDDNSKTVSFGQRKGSFNGMLKNRRFNIVLVKKDAPMELNLEDPKGILVNYSGKSTQVKL